MIHGVQEGKPVIHSGSDLRVPEVPEPGSVLSLPLSFLFLCPVFLLEDMSLGDGGGALIVYNLPLLPVHSLCLLSVVEDVVSLIPDGVACCQASPAIMAFRSGSISPNKLFLKSHLVSYHRHER